jgi:uncharacterized radical SAM superfamily Fe-S cluster-containing enzyme
MKKHYTYEYENDGGDIEKWDIEYEIYHGEIEIFSCTYNGEPIDKDLEMEEYENIKEAIFEHEADNEPDYYED